MTGKAPTKNEIIGLTQAQADSLKELSERVNAVEKSIEKQESRNDNIVYYVIFGLVFTVVIVAVEVILTSINTGSATADFSNQMMQMQATSVDQVNHLANQLELLKAKNPYLK